MLWCVVVWRLEFALVVRREKKIKSLREINLINFETGFIYPSFGFRRVHKN